MDSGSDHSGGDLEIAPADAVAPIRIVISMGSDKDEIFKAETKA